MDKIIFSDELTIQDVLAALDQSGKGLLCVIDEKGELQGVITDGDVRRALMKGALSVNEVINRSPVSIPYGFSKAEMFLRLKKLHKRFAPVIDEKSILREIIYLDDDTFGGRENRVVIMAGGIGSRLGSLTQETPKPMLKIDGKPVVEHIINKLSIEGFNKITICVNFKKEVIKNYFGDGHDHGVDIEYVEEKQRLGTAGALSLVKLSEEEKPVIVLNADVITTLSMIDLLDFHNRKKSTATMCVRTIEHQLNFGVVESGSDDVISDILEKPVYKYSFNMGIYVICPSVFKRVPVGVFYDMPTFFLSLMESGYKTYSYNTDEYWVDIGSVSDLEKAKQDMCKRSEK